MLPTDDSFIRSSPKIDFCKIASTDIVPSTKKMVYWESPREMSIIEFTGRPYMYVGKKILICHFGPDKNKAAKQKYRQIRDVS